MGVLPVSVIIPVRNAEDMIEDCLVSVLRSEPAEVIVVDGLSSDRTLEIARKYPVRIVSDEGKGVAAARMLGVRASSQAAVALIDVDIVLADGALARLHEEFEAGEYSALQADLVSTAGPGYWGQALAYHHNNGRSKSWPGLMATIFRREVLLQHEMDERFSSGEDIELRWRLRRANLKLGVSKRVSVTHRFGDTYEFAKGQWLADGSGLGRMVARHGWRAAFLLLIPLAGSVRGVALSLAKRKLVWIPYYLAYLVFNYLAMPRGLAQRM